MDGGQRIATANGAMLADPADLGNPDLFEPGYWAARGELIDVAQGRGSAWFIASASHQWALRHYRRGGWIARFSRDRYVWAGEARVRSFAEWRLLAVLRARGLPVPKPIAARYQRSGLLYRCDLITERIGGARPLSVALAEGPLDERTWHAIGKTIATLHAAGVDHADLNAHNILLGAADTGAADTGAADTGADVPVHVIDFDRGRLRAPGAWARGNLARLRRSLVKLARAWPAGRCSAAAWASLLAGYASCA